MSGVLGTEHGSKVSFSYTGRKLWGLTGSRVPRSWPAIVRWPVIVPLYTFDGAVVFSVWVIISVYYLMMLTILAPAFLGFRFLRRGRRASRARAELEERRHREILDAMNRPEG